VVALAAQFEVVPQPKPTAQVMKWAAAVWAGRMTAALARKSVTTTAAALVRNLEAAMAQARMPSCDYIGHPCALCHGYLDLLHGREEEEI
jgi:hypothetical protein